MPELFCVDLISEQIIRAMAGFSKKTGKLLG